MVLPNVVFCSLQNSGGSAIDPILKDALSAKGYFPVPFGPEGTTDRFRLELADGRIRQPFYHWTHNPAGTFDGLIGTEPFRFIYMHRDPRDVAVSWAHDYVGRGMTAGYSFRQVLEVVLTDKLPPQIMAAVDWIRSDCMVVTFEAMKGDMEGLVDSILTYISYDEPGESASQTPLPRDQIRELIKRHSFEAVTGRARGEDGETIRNDYMLRKGISGEWRKHFDEDLVRTYKRLFGLELVALGYPGA